MQRARMLNVMGWVRNLPDGRVEAVFEGEKENVMKMIEFCKLGPSSAIITNVDVFWEKHKAEFKDFIIRP
jgi:acylphosphatase